MKAHVVLIVSLKPGVLSVFFLGGGEGGMCVYYYSPLPQDRNTLRGPSGHESRIMVRGWVAPG